MGLTKAEQAQRSADEQRVLMALHKLTYGNVQTPGGVALRLKRWGYRGKREKPCDCPVARYLAAETGLPVRVLGHTVSIGQRQRRLECPWPVRAFVQEFDNGLYPDLIESAS